MSCYTYMVRCADDSLYTGWTTDLDQRINTHNLGQGAKYTKNRLPVKLVYSKEFKSKSKAMKFEYWIKKKLSKKEKEQLVSTFNKFNHN